MSSVTWQMQKGGQSRGWLSSLVMRLDSVQKQGVYTMSCPFWACVFSSLCFYFIFKPAGEYLGHHPRIFFSHCLEGCALMLKWEWQCLLNCLQTDFGNAAPPARTLQHAPSSCPPACTETWAQPPSAQCIAQISFHVHLLHTQPLGLILPSSSFYISGTPLIMRISICCLNLCWCWCEKTQPVCY